jgi:hypothetical protein
MPNVAGVVQKGEKAGLISFDDGGKPAWTPDFAKAKDVLKVGQPLPADWTLKDGEYGPQAFPPRPKGEGPKTAWRNTKEGAEYEQERMDRRTALMQAVAVGSGIPTELADKFYTWLRKTSGPAEAHMGKTERHAPTPPPETASPRDDKARSVPKTSGGEAENSFGEGGPASVSPPDPILGGVQTASRLHLQHTYKPGPRQGWVVCADCGHAKKEGE